MNPGSGSAFHQNAGSGQEKLLRIRDHASDTNQICELEKTLSLTWPAFQSQRMTLT